VFTVIFCQGMLSGTRVYEYGVLAFQALNLAERTDGLDSVRLGMYCVLCKKVNYMSDSQRLTG
jgi:hypothetical protein